MRNLTLWLIVVISVLVGTSVLLYQETVKLKAETVRLGSNQTVLMDSFNTFKTEAGNYAAQVDVLTLKVSELKGRNTSLEQTAKELGIKLKRVQSYSTTSTSTHVDVDVPAKDSTVIINQKPEQFKCFEYNDNWVSIAGCVGSKFTGTFCSKDTIRQIVHRVPKQWWFFKWGTKAIRQEVVSNNPYTKITFTEYIELK